MKLHEDKTEFEDLNRLTAKEFGLLTQFVEKDYYVVLGLKGLSKSDYVSHGIFKGGTALSKAYGVIKRFSEDIDIALMVSNKMLELQNRERLLKRLRKL